MKNVLRLAFILLAFFSCSTKEPAVIEEKPEEAPITIIPEIPKEPHVYNMEMVSIPGGSFSMGNLRTSNNLISQLRENTAHSVTLDSFLIGKYEVTQGQYYEIMSSYYGDELDENGFLKKMPSNNRTNLEELTPVGWMSLPAERVNWYETLVFCNLLSAEDGFDPVYKINDSTDPKNWRTIPLPDKDYQLPSKSINDAKFWDAVEMVKGANGYRLPSEAEWEFAARGGSGTPNDVETVKFTNSPQLVKYYEKYAWHSANAARKTHKIGSKLPNEIGLFDISGNVMEWCWDWFAVFGKDEQNNPSGPLSGKERIIRGGSFFYAPEYCHPGYRHKLEPWMKLLSLGFRVVRSE